MDDPDQSLPFLRKILSSLRQEVEGKATLIGFVGTPWTLAAYAMEGGADKSLVKTKTIMLQGKNYGRQKKRCLLSNVFSYGFISLLFHTNSFFHN
jgi:uroporphyrinogen-III decarboxylase